MILLGLFILVIVSLVWVIIAFNRYPITNFTRFKINSDNLDVKANTDVIYYQPNNSFFQSEKVWKGVIFLISILLAYKFIFISFEGLYELIVIKEKNAYLSLIYCYAWIAYFIMGIFWVVEIKLGKLISITGIIAGSISIVTVSIFVFPLFYLMPQMILAYQFVKFHNSRNDSNYGLEKNS